MEADHDRAPQALAGDTELAHVLGFDQELEGLQERLLVDDFLVLDPSVRVPFFAQTRDYVGAREASDPSAGWIAKPVRDEAVRQTEAASVCYFLDRFTETPSAPMVLTRIGGVLYRASRIVPRAEQLSGADYTDIPRLKEQLLLDLVNRWIYFDEDRNPNNYMIRYARATEPIVIAIDFSNADLFHTGIKIRGTEKSFGWERSEKTRYLTPLKVEHFLSCDAVFFARRLAAFQEVKRRMLLALCRRCFRHDPDGAALARQVAENLVHRIEYVSEYFARMLPRRRSRDDEAKYREMGKTFRRIYEAK